MPPCPDAAFSVIAYSPEVLAQANTRILLPGLLLVLLSSPSCIPHPPSTHPSPAKDGFNLELTFIQEGDSSLLAPRIAELGVVPHASRSRRSL